MRKRYYIRPLNSDLWVRVQLKEVRRLQEHHGKEKVILDAQDLPVPFKYLPVVFVEINQVVLTSDQGGRDSKKDIIVGYDLRLVSGRHYQSTQLP